MQKILKSAFSPLRNTHWHLPPGLVLLLLSIFSSPVLAVIMVTTGGSQEITAGTSSKDIQFKVLDETGNASTGTSTSTTNLLKSTRVRFTLTDPAGESITNGLSTTLAYTDDNGLVVTRLNATPVIGIYTITATLIDDTTQFANTYVIVTAGPPASLTVMGGENQTLAAGATSDPFTFRLTDAFGNALAEQSIVFTLTLPDGNSIGSNLTPPQANTDSQGQVNTQFTGLDLAGEYTLVAKLSDHDQVAASVKVSIKAALPNLPSLGFGGALNASGVSIDTDAVFYGGITTKEGDFQPEAVLTQEDTVAIEGVIKTDTSHVGQVADVLVVAGYQPINSANEWYYMLDNMGNYQRWDGQIHELESVNPSIKLPEDLMVKLYAGNFTATGNLRIYFGYRLSNGTVVFNEKQTINVVIKE